MESKKGIQLTQAFGAILVVVSIAVLVIMAIFIFVSLSDSSPLIISDTETLEAVYVNSAQSITPVGDGVYSETLTQKNQTWLEFDGDGDWIDFTVGTSYLGGINNFTLSTISLIFNTHLANDQQLGFKEAEGDIYPMHIRGTGYLGCNTGSVWSTAYPLNNDSIIHAIHTINPLTGNYSQYVDGNYISDLLCVEGRGLDVFGATGTNSLNGSIYSLVIFNESLNQSAIKSLSWSKNKNLNSYLQQYEIADTSHTDLSFWNTTNNVMSGSNKIYLGNTGKNNWTYIYNFTNLGYTGDSNTIGLYKTPDEELLVYIYHRGMIYKSQNKDLTNYTLSLNMSELGISQDCILNSTTRRQSYTTDNQGNIYFGVYSDGSTTEQCGKIFKSTDNATSWTLIYNGTARHTHVVFADLYTDKIYASFGDGDSQKKFIRSDDYGSTWIDLGYGVRTDGGMDWQITALTSYDGYRVLGEDFFDDSDSRSRIFITYDDINFLEVFDPLYNQTGFYNGFFKDSKNRTITTTCTIKDGQKPTAYMSENGINWNIIYQQEINQNGSVCMGLPTFEDSENNIYFKLAKNLSYGNYQVYRWKLIDFPNPKIDLSFKEDSGIMVYDKSENFLNASITGATWANDGINVSLTENVDYTLSSDGTLTIINSEKEYAWYELTWTYISSNARSASNSFIDEFSNYPKLIGLVGTIIFLALIITIIVSAFTLTGRKV